MKRIMGILLVISLFLTSMLLSVSAQEEDDSLTLDDFVLDGLIDTGLGLTFRYPTASNWRPAEGIEGVLGRGSVMVLDGYGAPFPRLEVFPVTSRSDLITVAREALTEWTARTFVLALEIDSQISETMTGREIGIVFGDANPVVLVIVTVRIAPNRVAVFRFSSNSDPFFRASDSGDLIPLNVMYSTVEDPLNPLATPTPSNTATITLTPSITFTPSITPTPSMTFTPSITPTPSLTFTPSATFTPSRTPTPTFTPTFTPTASACAGNLAPRMVVGQDGRVILDGVNTSNRLRNGAGTSFSEITRIPPGDEFEVIGGPECANGYTWWQVNYNGRSGWTAESGDRRYWIEPILEESATDGGQCFARAGSSNINLRTGPGTNNEVGGRLNANTQALIVSQTINTTGNIWYELANGFWVRNDVIQLLGSCDNIPES